MLAPPSHSWLFCISFILLSQINFFLLLGCIAMVAGFQDTTALGHAYGVAVMSVMFITTFLSGIVMLVCYDVNPVLVTLFLILFGGCNAGILELVESNSITPDGYLVMCYWTILAGCCSAES
jgi:KUP system potassium uptake protein